MLGRKRGGRQTIGIVSYARELRSFSCGCSPSAAWSPRCLGKRSSIFLRERCRGQGRFGFRLQWARRSAQHIRRRWWRLRIHRAHWDPDRYGDDRPRVRALAITGLATTASFEPRTSANAPRNETWLCGQTSWSTSCGSAPAIISNAGSRPQLDVVFELFDRYRKLRPVTLRSAKLDRRHAPTGRRVTVELESIERRDRSLRVCTSCALPTVPASSTRHGILMMGT